MTKRRELVGISVKKGSLPPTLSVSSKIDLAWIAGFFDGEGCISASQWMRKKRLQCEAIINIGQAEKGLFLLQSLRVLFGGSIYYRKSKNKKHSDSYVWSIASQKAVKFLLLILPFLYLKRHQALLVIELYKTKDYTGGKGFRITPEIYCFRETIKEEIKYLNRRGPQ